MNSSQRGLTLIELMVAIAVLAIIVGAGVPALSNLVINSRMTSFVNTTMATARIARGEAIRRNRAVTFCPSADMSSCTTPELGQGYIVFEDGGTPRVRDATDEILLVQPLSTGHVSASFSAGSDVRFRQSGQVDSGAAISVVLCDSRGADHARTLRMLITGRVLNLGHTGSETCS